MSTVAAASRLGYQPEAAFSRAFKRTIGVSPGAIRRDGNAMTFATPDAALTVDA